uniref:Uncharacterized protein n=1 Tax=Oryza nivara TaxID=4536 RepID=A0A0E0I689_ORYNI
MKNKGTEEGRNKCLHFNLSGYFNRDQIVHPDYITGTINGCEPGLKSLSPAAKQFQRKTCFEMRGGKKKKKKD